MSSGTSRSRSPRRRRDPRLRQDEDGDAEQEIQVCTVNGEAGRAKTIERKAVPVHKDEPLKVEITAFLQSVRTRTPRPVTGDDGMKALDVALQIIRSIHEKQKAS